MIFNFNDGTTIEIADEKLYEIQKSLYIHDFKDRILNCGYNIKHKDTNEDITEKEAYDLASQITEKMYNNDEYWTYENNFFEDILYNICRINNYREDGDWA